MGFMLLHIASASVVLCGVFMIFPTLCKGTIYMKYATVIVLRSLIIRILIHHLGRCAHLLSASKCDSAFAKWYELKTFHFAHSIHEGFECQSPGRQFSIHAYIWYEHGQRQQGIALYSGAMRKFIHTRRALCLCVVQNTLSLFHALPISVKRSENVLENTRTSALSTRHVERQSLVIHIICGKWFIKKNMLTKKIN